MKKITIITILFISLFSCSEKDLDIDNPNNLTKNFFWKTGDDLEAGLAATYQILGDNYKGIWGVVGVEITNTRADDVIMRNDVRSRYEVSSFLNTSDNSAVGKIYKGCYQGIFRANQVIHNSKNIKMDETKKNILVAEAKFLRALMYFKLVTNWGETPLILTLPTKREDYFNGPNTIDEIWNQVIIDLNEAVKFLKISHSTNYKGRITKGAAIAYLGKTYLYRKEYTKAAIEFAKLVDNESTYGYKLMDDYKDNFGNKKENNSESILQVQFSFDGGDKIWTNSWSQQTRTTFMAQEFAPGEVGGWFEIQPSEFIFNEFKKEKTVNNDFDPRMYCTLSWDYPGSTFYTVPFKELFKVNTKSIWFKKNQNYDQIKEIDAKSDNNENIMRYADVILMYAETLLENKQYAKAAKLIQRIRTRAKLKDIETEMATWSETKIMDEIIHQRVIEFCREGIRFDDLRRWGILEKTLISSKTEGWNLFSKKFTIFPIPQSELENNPKMRQNSFWK